MDQINKSSWTKEYREFSDSDYISSVPPEVFKNLKSKLFPNPWVVFSKTLILHSFVGFLSLGICNQFGLNPFNMDKSLMNWFMKIGDQKFCMIACGIFFMTTTYIVANFILTLEEIETLRRYEWLQVGVLGLISIAAFYFFGAELITLFIGLWILGGLFGALVAIEGSYHFRRQWV